MKNRITYQDALEAAEWRKNVWGPVIWNTLQTVAEKRDPSELSVLEIGFGRGRMAALLARLGMKVTGIEHPDSNLEPALEYIRAKGLSERCHLSHQDLFTLSGQFDMVFMKSVLYHIGDANDYEKWIARITELLKPDGMLVVIENGSGNAIVKNYRRYFHRWKSYYNNILSSNTALYIFEKHFGKHYIRTYYTLSQFLPYRWVIKLDNALFRPDFNHCFIYSMIAETPIKD